MRYVKMAWAIALIFAFMVICSPASAVILEESYQGWISKLEPSSDKVTVYVTEVYEGGTWVTYGKSSLKNMLVEGTTSNPSVFTDLKQGDPVEV